MGDIFCWIDSFILEKFEKFSHWFQYRTGKTNFFLAKVAFLAAMIGVAWRILIELPDSGYAWSGDFFLDVSFVIIISPIVLMAMDHQEKVTFKNQLNGEGNSDKIDRFWIVMRILSLFFTSLVTSLVMMIWFSSRGTVKWWDLIFMFGGTAWVYFKSCDPLPPGTERIKKRSPAFLRQQEQDHSS
jgi:hypothetical protein